MQVFHNENEIFFSEMKQLLGNSDVGERGAIWQKMRKSDLGENYKFSSRLYLRSCVDADAVLVYFKCVFQCSMFYPLDPKA